MALSSISSPFRPKKLRHSR